MTAHDPNKTAPVQGCSLRIPWSVHLKAYDVYAAKYGRGQSAERLAERGGFCTREMDQFHPSWREEVEEIPLLRQQIELQRARAEKAERAIVRPELVKVGESVLATDRLRAMEARIKSDAERIADLRQQLEDAEARAHAAESRVRAWRDGWEPPALEDYSAVGPPDIAELIEAAPRFEGERPGDAVDITLEPYECVVSRSEIVAYGRHLAWQQERIDELEKQVFAADESAAAHGALVQKLNAELDEARDEIGALNQLIDDTVKGPNQP